MKEKKNAGLSHYHVEPGGLPYSWWLDEEHAVSNFVCVVSVV